MKTLFEIGDRSANAGIILSEWGDQYCLIAGYDNHIGRVNWLTYKTFDILDKHTVQHILNDITAADKILVSSTFPECLLTPIHYNINEALVELFPDSSSSSAFADTVTEWQLKSNYLIPTALPVAITDRFSSVSYIHYFTALLKSNNSISAEGQISIQFAPNQFSVLVKKNNQLQLAQTYKYVTPLDVVYYLLKIVEAFSLSVNDTVLLISGLVEENSDLFVELNQYFKHIEFSIPPGETLNKENYPAHFFTSLYNLSTCVS